LRLIFVTPKARTMSACLASPLTQNWAVIMRGGQIVLVVDKHRHAAVEVGRPPILLAERQHGSDVRNALGEDRQLDL